ncbi:hypothetical protein [Streptomyces sp. NPDC052114]|uniref:hypothetical protein n=1 Tax=unclassified Streptomyces TaxID=2593676 RepID=UPI0034435CAC
MPTSVVNSVGAWRGAPRLDDDQMVKSGSNSRKSRTRTRSTRTGVTYQQASGTGRTDSRQRRLPQVVQFLARYQRCPLTVAQPLAAAWADQGLEVLLLRQPEETWPTLNFVRKNGKMSLEEPPVEHGPRATVLWAHPTGPGRLVEYRCPWTSDVGGPLFTAQTYRESYEPLRQAVEEMRPYFDIIILCDEGEFPMCLPAAEAFVLVAYTDLPRTESQLVLTADGTQSTQRALTPQQSAAILRDRQLRHITGLALRSPVVGMVCASKSDPIAPDPAFAHAVAADMAATGLPIAGWVTGPELHGFTSAGPQPPYAPTDPAAGYHHAAASLLQLPYSNH